MPSSSGQELETFVEPTIIIEHFEYPTEGKNETPKRRKRKIIAKYFCDDCTVYLVDDTSISI
jgi:hypothetical protein